MSDRWTDLLSDYIDGHLDAPTVRELEAHLAGCDRCNTTLTSLRAVTARARTLGPVEPARDLWPAIATRLTPKGARRWWFTVVLTRLLGHGEGEAAGSSGLAPALRALTARRLSFSLPQLAAASLALVLISSGVAWMTLRGRPAPSPAPPAAQPGLVPGGAVVGLAQYDTAIAELERVLAEHRAQLDTSTVRVVEQNLAAIDRAIADARRALALDPNDSYLHDHLATTMRRKMELLRRAAAVAAYPT